MDPEQFQHLMNMLRGLQQCITFVAWAIVWHMILSGPSTSGIKEELGRIASKLK